MLLPGNSSNGLPKSIQGVWWQDGIKFDEVCPSNCLNLLLTSTKQVSKVYITGVCRCFVPTYRHIEQHKRGLVALGFQELISSSGVWDPALRRLTIPSSGPRNWGAHDDSSVKAPGGLFWLPSGAAHMNWIISVKGSAEIYFNEVRPSHCGGSIPSSVRSNNPCNWQW
jgi:hypothetical protein